MASFLYKCALNLAIGERNHALNMAIGKQNQA